MSSPGLPRSTIVNALDDLDERDKIADAWLTDADDSPYPPTAIRERSRRLRWRLRGRRIGGALFVLLLVVTGAMGIAGWTIPGALYSFLFGGGIAFLAAFLFANPWSERPVRALQLYDLLRELDDPSENAS